MVSRSPWAVGLGLIGPLCVYLACTVGPLDYTGKTCDGTCPAPWSCFQGACVVDAGTETDATHADRRPDAPADGGSDGRAEAGRDARGDGRTTGSDTSTTETGTDSGIIAEQSCAPGGFGMTNCGPGGSGSGSCCNSLAVAGGTFDRSYHINPANPATVSSFRLDQYEITAGRFRQFVTAVDEGWLPPAGSGKHTHLNGGKGLNATGGGYESGWDSSWDGSLATTLPAWTANLRCDSSYQTWAMGSGIGDSKPINCETWYEAYAFCIWDGGFLPSDAEWEYAAGGGAGDGGQRVYPWSTPSTNAVLDCSHANYLGPDGGSPCVAAGPNNVGSESPTGDGYYGQADMAGNLWEWNLDWFAAYVDSCNTDCANLSSPPGTERVFRGGAFANNATDLVTSYRDYYTPSTRHESNGARCARIP